VADDDSFGFVLCPSGFDPTKDTDTGVEYVRSNCRGWGPIRLFAESDGLVCNDEERKRRVDVGLLHFVDWFAPTAAPASVVCELLLLEVVDGVGRLVGNIGVVLDFVDDTFLVVEDDLRPSTDIDELIGLCFVVVVRAVATLLSPPYLEGFMLVGLGPVNLIPENGLLVHEGLVPVAFGDETVGFLFLAEGVSLSVAFLSLLLLLLLETLFVQENVRPGVCRFFSEIEDVLGLFKLLETFLVQENVRPGGVGSFCLGIEEVLVCFDSIFLVVFPPPEGAAVVLVDCFCLTTSFDELFDSAFLVTLCCAVRCFCLQSYRFTGSITVSYASLILANIS
jgi:hypothetical protein